MYSGSNATIRLDPRADDLGCVPLVDHELVALQRQHGEEGDEATVSDATGHADRHPARSTVGGELVHEPALADPGVADDSDREALTRARPAQRGLQRSPFRAAADELGQPAGGGDRLKRVRAGPRPTSSRTRWGPPRP